MHPPHIEQDVGAMRFPKIPFMNRTFDLFRRLDIRDSGPGALLINYVMSNPHNINLYNGHKLTNKQLESTTDNDPFKTNVKGLFGTTEVMVNTQIGGFREAIVENFEEGWRKLMEYDGWSTRGYMTLYGMNGTKYSNEVRLRL